MKVKLTKDFTCYPPDDPGTRHTYRKGEELTGRLAEWAMAVGAATAPSAKAAPQKKAAKAAPENK